MILGTKSDTKSKTDTKSVPTKSDTKSVPTKWDTKIQRIDTFSFVRETNWIFHNVDSAKSISSHLARFPAM